MTGPFRGMPATAPPGVGTLRQPLPGLDWLRLLPHDPVAAVRDFVAGWFADVPPGDDGLGDQDETLPEPLLAFYRAAAGAGIGLHNEIYHAGELEDEDDGRVLFGAENQGVFVMLLDLTEADPVVQYEGLPAEREREPLSALLLQFLLPAPLRRGIGGRVERVSGRRVRSLGRVR